MDEHALALLFPYFMKIITTIDNLNHKLSPENYRNRIYGLFEWLGVSSPEEAAVRMRERTVSVGLVPHEHEYIDKELILRNVNVERLQNNPIVITQNIFENDFFLK